MNVSCIIVTVSDRCAADPTCDGAGPAVAEHLPAFNGRCEERVVVPDEVAQVRAVIESWASRTDLILLTGGTGIAERDVTPEAVEPLIEKTLPGFGEAMRAAGGDNPHAILSRGGAGVADRTLIVWMPGSPSAVHECLARIAPAISHACELLRGRTDH